LKGMRKSLRQLIVRDFEQSLIAESEFLRPELLLVFKGQFVTAKSLNAIRALGTVAINYYPDVSFMSHGPYLAKSLPLYDWIFTTKSYGVADLARELGMERASFMPHPFDPETHVPVVLDGKDRARYAGEAAFIGTWSPKKEAMLHRVRRELPDLDLKIWGNQWERATVDFGTSLMRRPIVGLEYAKAIRATSINIAMLSEARGEATSGDLTTTRTFEIPAAGGFMLHERTAEAGSFFAEGRECAMFADARELVAKLRHYRVRPNERQQLAQAGHHRAMTSGYSADERAATIVQKALQLRSGDAVVEQFTSASATP